MTTLRTASLIVIGSVWLVWPGSAAAVDVNYQPSEARPGTRISVSGDICLYQLGEQLLFSDRLVPQLPDGQTDTFKPVAVVDLTPVGGEQTENGINTSLQVFVVPRVPAGDYYLYANCLDDDVCCKLLEPILHVLAAPDTATASRVPSRTAPPWLLLGAFFVLGVAMMAYRLRSPRRAPDPSPR